MAEDLNTHFSKEDINVDIRKLFIWVGATTMLLVASLALGAIYMLEMHVKELNRRRTEKGRATKLRNLENNKAVDVEIDQILFANEPEQKEKGQEEESPG